MITNNGGFASEPKDSRSIIRLARVHEADESEQFIDDEPLGDVDDVEPLHEDGGDPFLIWDVEDGSAENYRKTAARLSGSGDLFRNKDDGHGLIHVLPSGESRLITKASELAPLLVDRVRMIVMKNGKVVSELPTAAHLNAMLRSEMFLREFIPVDEVTTTPFYLDDLSLVRPGYNDGGPGNRVLYVGDQPPCVTSIDTINQFLDVMPFETNADRTNTVAAALTLLFRRQWQGEKPVIPITSTRSHSGKGTITDFIRGTVPKAELLYESIDWPMQSQFQKQLRMNPDAGLVVFDNVRLDSSGGRAKCIRSAFLESFVTSPEIFLTSPGAGEPMRLANKYVVTINTNDGALSPDLMNRSLPIHLAPRGDVHDSKTPIGNPKLEFLPKNRDLIEAEFRGMIETWKDAGCPTDEEVRHPMSPWAKIIGGILMVNGFKDFLANYRARKSVDDPVKQSLGILGAARPGEKLRPMEWAKTAVDQGLAKILFSTVERDSEKGRERAIGGLLKNNLDVVVETSTESKRYRLQIEGGFMRWERGKNAHTRYAFTVLHEEDIPVDADPTHCAN